MFPLKFLLFFLSWSTFFIPESLFSVNSQLLSFEIPTIINKLHIFGAWHLRIYSPIVYSASFSSWNYSLISGFKSQAPYHPCNIFPELIWYCFLIIPQTFSSSNDMFTRFWFLFYMGKSWNFKAWWCNRLVLVMLLLYHIYIFHLRRRTLHLQVDFFCLLNK